MDGLAGRRVLTVDDSSTVRAYVARALGRHGASVDGAESGAEALARLDAGAYDLVILDLLLPDTDGLQLLRTIRGRDQDSTVVMLTGIGGVRSALSAMQFGADGYLQKQDLSELEPDLFLHTLEQSLAHRRSLVAQRQLDQVKSDFYAVVTHDLRNPANVVAEAVKLVAREGADQLAPTHREMLRLAESAAEKLLRLINDYLDFALIDAGALTLSRQPTDLRALVEACAEAARLQARAHRQVVELDLPASALGAELDAERFRQVVDNLLSNAVKYTPDGGRIGVRLRAEGAEAVLRVEDSGVGIPAAELPALFTKYHRVPGEATRRVRGTGLGLMIVKNMVEAHGGTVRAESEGPGRGSAFVITLPLPAVPPA